jgi:hypothetical protein
MDTLLINDAAALTHPRTYIMCEHSSGRQTLSNFEMRTNCWHAAIPLINLTKWMTYNWQLAKRMDFFSQNFTNVIN